MIEKLVLSDKMWYLYCKGLVIKTDAKLSRETFFRCDAIVSDIGVVEKLREDLREFMTNNIKNNFKNYFVVDMTDCLVSEINSRLKSHLVAVSLYEKYTKLL